MARLYSSRLNGPTELYSRSSTEEERLVALASRGDVDAFSKLVSDNSNLVYGVALRVLGAEGAKDASQEVWVRVLRNIGSFRAQSAFSTWLYRITMNTCLSLRRKESRRVARERNYSGEEEMSCPLAVEPPGGEGDPEAAALDSERRRQIQAALVHVRKEHRAALILRHIEGLTYAEIAAVLEVPGGTAKGWVSRGKAAMLVALEKEDARRGRVERGPRGSDEDAG